MQLVLSALLRMAIWGQSTGIPRHEWEHKVRAQLNEFKDGDCRSCNTRCKLNSNSLCEPCQEEFDAWVKEKRDNEPQ